MIKIEEYMLRSRSERRTHLKLEESCLERGGLEAREYRGLLAHILDTTIPSGMQVFLCHACNNSKCSNPNHLYWGTPKDNVQDSIECGTYKSPQESCEKKYGKAVWRKMQRAAFQKANQISCKKSALTSEQIREYRDIIDSSNPTKFGWVGRAATKLDLSHTQVRRFVKKYYTELKYFERKLTRR